MRYWVLTGFLVVCLLFAGPDNKELNYDYQKDPNVTTWLSKKKARELMRYHGTYGILITESDVYIKRDGRWISVYRNPSFLPEGGDQPDSPTTGLRVERNTS